MYLYVAKLLTNIQLSQLCNISLNFLNAKL